MGSGNYLKFDLSFKRKDFEKEFTLSKISYQKIFLYIISLYGLLVGVIGWAINPLDRPLYQGAFLFYIIFLIIIILFAIYVSRKRPAFSGYMSVLLVLYYYFGLMENTHRNKAYWNNIMYFVTGINFEFILIPLIFSKIKWQLFMVLFIVFNVLCCFRYTDFMENYEMRFYPMIQFLNNIVLLVLSAYFIEKNDRENFYKLKNYERSLSHFRDLIKHLFPSAIIICNNEKLLFKNSETFSIFDCTDDKEIWMNLQTVKLEQPYKNSKQGDEITLQDEEKIFIKRSPLQTENLTIEEFISNNFAEQNFKERFQINYYGLFEKGGCIPKYLDITITNIDWDNQSSIMIIMKESKLLSNMKYLKDEALYKDRLLATVSHDLRTPLNGIMGMISISGEMVEDPEIKEYLTIALNSSKLLLLMINDILDYSQIANGKLRLSFEIFSLWDLIREVSKLFKFQVKMKGLELIKENSVKGENTTSIRSDQSRIKQILFNLLGNALKFTTKGSIKISLSEHTKNRVTSEKSIRNYSKVFQIRVEDTGIGIKKEHIPSLFKMYGKLEDEKSMHMNRNGVGLGLAICKSLIEILNGRTDDCLLKVESEYMKGTSFSFLLYSMEDENSVEDIWKSNLEEKLERDMTRKVEIIDRDVKTKKNKNMGQLQNKIPNILVVDDDQINVLVACSYLKVLRDSTFDVAFNGEEALTKIRKRAELNEYFDVILMDCQMPKMDGFEASKIINQMIDDQIIPMVAIIACTANASVKDYQVCFEYGMIDYIPKPFSKDQLKKTIDKNLKLLRNRKFSYYIEEECKEEEEDV